MKPSEIVSFHYYPPPSHSKFSTKPKNCSDIKAQAQIYLFINFQNFKIVRVLEARSVYKYILMALGEFYVFIVSLCAVATLIDTRLVSW